MKNTQNTKQVNLFETLIKSTQGRFCTVYFTKSDGTVRALNGRVGKQKNGDYLVMYDIKLRAYRSVNVKSIHKLRLDGLEVALPKTK